MAVYDTFKCMYKYAIEQALEELKNDIHNSHSVNIVATLHDGHTYNVRQIETIRQAQHLLDNFDAIVVKSCKPFITGTASINKDYHVIFTINDVSHLGYSRISKT